MLTLGIGGLQGDTAAAVLRNDALVAAIEESKLSRQRSHRFPTGALPDRAIATCLDLASARPSDVDTVAVVRPIPATGDFHLQLRAHFPNSRIAIIEHHQAHAASAYYCSPFDEATVLTLDRGSDFRCGARWRARGGQLTLEQEHYSPDSIGDLYGRVTELLGMEANADEHKVQWLSVSGDDRFRGLFAAILQTPNSTLRIDRTFFSNDRVSDGGFGTRFYECLRLKPGEPIPDELRPHIAAGLQRAVEDAVIRLAGEGENVCLAGGLGLNALLVSALENRSAFKNVFVQPVAGNAGTAIGAVLQERRARLTTLNLGPAFTAAEIKQVVENCKLRFHYLVTTDEVIDAAVAQLTDSKIVAWMHGRMEFGSRALGNRSILASPLDPYSSENLNIFIKHREPFRKFAASVPAELAAEYFEVGPNARWLATVGRVREPHRERFAAATLAGDLVRVHTVDRDENPLYWKLLHAAGKATGLPVLFNTSFNLFGEPLVCTPRDAVRSFYSSGIDALFIGNFFLQK
jgi:carbamoyltransferase